MLHSSNTVHDHCPISSLRLIFKILETCFCSTRTWCFVLLPSSNSAFSKDNEFSSENLIKPLQPDSDLFGLDLTKGWLRWHQFCLQDCYQNKEFSALSRFLSLFFLISNITFIHFFEKGHHWVEFNSWLLWKLRCVFPQNLKVLNTIFSC